MIVRDTLSSSDFTCPPPPPPPTHRDENGGERVIVRVGQQKCQGFHTVDAPRGEVKRSGSATAGGERLELKVQRLAVVREHELKYPRPAGRGEFRTLVGTGGKAVVAVAQYY